MLTLETSDLLPVFLSANRMIVSANRMIVFARIEHCVAIVARSEKRITLNACF